MTKPVSTLCESGETHNTAMTRTGQKECGSHAYTQQKPPSRQKPVLT